MNQRALIITIVLFVLIVGGMFLFASLQREKPPVNEDTTMEPDETDEQDMRIINAKQFYIDGTHTLVGTINMPTPCDLLEATATVESPQSVMIDFTVTNNADVCEQVVSPQRFKVTFDAEENAKISARYEGEKVRLNLFPAGPDETPDDFEIFIKG